MAIEKGVFENHEIYRVLNSSNKRNPLLKKPVILCVTFECFENCQFSQEVDFFVSKIW